MKRVIGTDSRKELITNAYDKLIGYVESDDIQCTAFVTGDREVTTSAHCVEFLKIPEFKLKDGRTYQIESIKKLDLARDLAVLKTKANFKDYLTFTEFQEGVIQILSFDISSNTIKTSDDCRAISWLPEFSAFTNDCDTSFGNSGSPILQNGKVVGIHV